MKQGQASHTALGAARHRAVHQIVEKGAIFSDPLAVSILGEDMGEVVSDAEEDPARKRLRLFIAVRTHYAEARLAEAVRAGTSQLVVLGAGLDTFAYRSPFGESLRVFEVDHPATQEWKRERLAAARIGVPGYLTYAPIDFEKEELEAGLAAAGFDRKKPSFFTWLGVVPYLSEAAVFATLGYVAGLSARSEVVFDYANPMRDNADMARLAARVAAAGESFKCFFESEDLRQKLVRAGFDRMEDLGPKEIRDRYFQGRGAPGSGGGGHVVWAGRFRDIS